MGKDFAGNQGHSSVAEWKVSAVSIDLARWPQGLTLILAFELDDDLGALNCVSIKDWGYPAMETFGHMNTTLHRVKIRKHFGDELALSRSGWMQAVRIDDSWTFPFQDLLDQGNNSKLAVSDYQDGLPAGAESAIMRLQMIHVRGAACFGVIKKMEGKFFKGPKSAFVPMGIEVPVLGQPPSILQTLLDPGMDNLSTSFRDNIRKFNC